EDAGKDPIKRATLIKDIVHSISVIPDGIVRSVYARECSKLLEIDETTLYNGINQQKKKQQERQNKTANFASREPIIPVFTENLRQTAEVVSFTDSPEEREIIRCLMRYGEQKFHVGNTEISVAQYIVDDLESDQLELSNPLYQLCIEKAKSCLNDESWVAEQYFTQHQNADISRLAADLVTDNYLLSNMHLRREPNMKTEQDRLHEFVPRAVNEFKNKFIAGKRKELEQQIKTAQENGDVEAILPLMRQISELDKIKQLFAKHLGERIITK
ncbi:MAG: hypothetical protein LBR75_02275, partial [Prevotellaceae bacterium]|nr:hypothetical protein [Prevotellaceae bacterium]